MKGKMVGYTFLSLLSFTISFVLLRKPVKKLYLRLKETLRNQIIDHNLKEKFEKDFLCILCFDRL